MSCNGCRVLRKGCSESCILRPCLQWIDNPESQGHATVFVAKFFGRAGLMSFISAVPENQRPDSVDFPAIFQSLLYEACGRTVNPVNGAVGLLWSGNWHVCQSAVETVLRGGTLRSWPEIPAGFPVNSPVPDDASEASPTKKKRVLSGCSKPSVRPGCGEPPELPETGLDLSGCSKSSIRQGCSEPLELPETKLDLSLSSSFPAFAQLEKQRPGTPSLNSEGSVTSLESAGSLFPGDHKLLNLFP